MTKSAELFERAQELIPGGVNSPVRAFNSVGGTPVFFDHAKGAYAWSADGDKYIDYCGSWGPLILGHAREEVLTAVNETAAKGMSFGTCTELEITLAEQIIKMIPSVDKVRLVNSGTEATMTALRLARGVTGRNKVIKFAGCYHGHADSFLVAAGSGLLTAGISSSAGVPDKVVEDIHLVPYNDLAAVKEIVDNLGDDLAAIIVEPIAGNMGLIEPLDGFLQGLKDLTQSCGALLIFDEVINGFRLGPTTYGQSIGIEADITTLGKIIGGGMPIGAFVAKKEIMDHLSPLGDVYQAGTLSGNPVAVATGLKTLQILEAESPYGEIDRLGAKLEADTRESLASIGAHIKRLGGVFTLFFAKGPLTNLDDVQGCDFDRFKDFYHKMLAAGIYLPPSQYECAFISAAHTEADVDVLIAAINAYTP